MIKNLIIGFGSEILSDQSIIPDLINNVSPNFSDNIDFSCELISSLDLIGLFEGYNQLLILDTVQMPNLAIGALQYYSFADYKPSLHLENYHDSSIIESIETARKLGIKMPEKIGIVVINTKEIYTLSTSYCDELTRKYPDLLYQLKTLIKHFFKLKVEKVLVVD